MSTNTLTRSQRRAALLTRINGWVFLVFFGLVTLASPFLEPSIPGLAGTLMLTLAPGAALVYGGAKAFNGDRFWWRVTLYSMFLTTTLFAALAYIGGGYGIFAIIAAYVLGLSPMLTLIRMPHPKTSSQRHQAVLVGVYVLLLVVLVAAAWLTQLGI